MEKKQSLYRAAFGTQEANSPYGDITQESVKSLYPEIFIANTSKSRRDRLFSAKFAKKYESNFNTESYLSIAKFHAEAMSRYRYSSALARLVRKLSSSILSRILKNKRRIRLDAELILASDFFDPEWYQTQYGLDGTAFELAEHFLLRGYTSLLDPSKNFSTSAYLFDNPDVISSPINPLVHYLNFGIKEMRKIKPSTSIEGSNA